MSVVLHHHPQTRAANVVWLLEEVGCEYTLEYVDLKTGAQKSDTFKALNPMGKVPTLLDGDVVVAEVAAIGMYLADKYAAGRLAPALDAPERGAYLRWICYGPSVIEPGCMAKAAGWDFKPGSAGWGSYEEMLATIDVAVGEGPYLLGEQFTMADMLFGGTIGWMMQFGMLPKKSAWEAYVGRLEDRPARKKAREINAAIAAEQGL
ncbi:MAG: glutathione S-transferase family protein [Nannocystaceae bacterium]|nr:glutathione S-transferase family protein [bacterium]